jgi:hypothetical protein
MHQHSAPHCPAGCRVGQAPGYYVLNHAERKLVAI